MCAKSTHVKNEDWKTANQVSQLALKAWSCCQAKFANLQKKVCIFAKLTSLQRKHSKFCKTNNANQVLQVCNVILQIYKPRFAQMHTKVADAQKQHLQHKCPNRDSATKTHLQNAKPSLQTCNGSLQMHKPIVANVHTKFAHAFSEPCLLSATLHNLDFKRCKQYLQVLQD